MNKKSLYVAGIVMSLSFFSCSEEVEDMADSGQPKDIEVINNGTLLKFKDQATFEATISALNSLNEIELKEWSSSLRFRSMHQIFEEALSEAAKLDNSESAYVNFKSKYEDVLFFPEYLGDLGPYLPVSKNNVSVLLNNAGDVMIGDAILNFKDINTYEELKSLGRTIPEPSNNLRSSVRTNYYEDEVGSRKWWVKIRRLDESVPTGEAVAIHIEVSFRKRVWIGWINYGGEMTRVKGTLYPKEYPSMWNGNPIWNLNDYNPWERTGTSSHDYYIRLYAFANSNNTANSWWYYPSIKGTIRAYIHEENFGRKYVDIPVSTDISWTRFPLFKSDF